MSKLDSLYFSGFILGEVIKERLTISGHAGQFDSSLALQNIQAGHPFTITLRDTNPLSVVSTNGKSISSESCERIGFNKFQSSCSGGSKNIRILPLNSIRLRAFSDNDSNCSFKSSCRSLSLSFFAFSISYLSCLIFGFSGSLFWSTNTPFCLTSILVDIFPINQTSSFVNTFIDSITG